MPIWYHFAASPRLRRLNGSAPAKCLTERHNLRLVGEAVDLAISITDPSHVDSSQCECYSCMEIERGTDCPHPNRCVKKAQELLDTLPTKWDPRSPPFDSLARVPNGDDENQGTDRYFNRQAIVKGNIAEIFRIFTEGDPLEGRASLTHFPVRRDEQRIFFGKAKKLPAIGDGTIFGAGVFFKNDEARNLKIRYDSRQGSPDASGVILAIAHAVAKADKHSPLALVLASDTTVNVLTKKLSDLENCDFVGIEDAYLLKNTIGILREHKAPIRFVLQKEPVGKDDARKADILAREALLLVCPSPLVEASHTFLISGARLSTMSQALAYKLIKKGRNGNQPPARPRTEDTLRRVKTETLESTGKRISDPLIWRAIRNPDLSRQARYFLWMLLHDAYKVGSHWNRDTMPPELKARARCAEDGQLETMEHILSECSSPGQKEIWRLAQTLWTKKTRNGKWRQPSTPSILVNAMAPDQGKKNEPDDGTPRFLKLLTTESAHLIWKLRCERVIRNENQKLSITEVENRWLKAINDRLKLDQQLTNTKLGKKAIPRNLVKETWKGTLHAEHALPEDWIGCTGVLVGMSFGIRRGEG
ncbi:hypothetical protein DXG01_009287 [Tephrocybe rancida]|nr:hypothetical protein DXG01_016842 [Tephrocybe rancida]KAG6915917.1 hypothetical protein DXG01_009287 [Tephrocybe rancida]